MDTIWPLKMSQRRSSTQMDTIWPEKYANTPPQWPQFTQEARVFIQKVWKKPTTTELSPLLSCCLITEHPNVTGQFYLY
jgi:hypothetical protein